MRRFRFAVVIAAYATLALTAAAQLPVSVDRDAWRPLTQSIDTDLYTRLNNKLLEDNYRASLILRQRMAVGLVDLSNPSRPKFAHANGQRMLYAASLPKIAILLAAASAFEDGRLDETPEYIDELTRMIRVSSNTASTSMIDRLGFDYIEQVLTDPKYKLFDKDRGGGLWVGKRYGAGGKRNPDPIGGLSHAATAEQVCRFYYLMATGRLVNPARSKQMLSIMVDPQLHHKFVGELEEIAPNADIYRKSGTYRQWHSDSALVWGPEWRRYILVGLVEDEKGDEILRDLVPLVDELLKPATVRN